MKNCYLRTESEMSKSAENVKDSEPRRIRLLTWNIDGLDTDDLVSRTKAVCAVIQRSVYVNHLLGKSDKQNCRILLNTTLIIDIFQCAIIFTFIPILNLSLI